jgi:hypothetical protein
MNRRSFLRSTASFAALSALPFTLDGCDTTTVADFVSVIATYAASLASYFGVTGLASQITVLEGQIATDIANWQAGSAAADAIAAINDLIGLVNQIPIAVPYAPLIVLILSALTGLLALLPNSVPAMTQTTRDVINHRNVTPTHYNGFDKHSMTSGKKSFTSQWSSIVASNHLTVPVASK